MPRNGEELNHPCDTGGGRERIVLQNVERRTRPSSFKSSKIEVLILWSTDGSVKI